MRKLFRIALLAGVAGLAQIGYADAQSVGFSGGGAALPPGTATTTAPTLTNNSAVQLSMDLSGNLRVITSAGTSSGNPFYSQITNFPATQPISAASLPLPAGAATSANQTPGVAAGATGTLAQPMQGIPSGVPVAVSGAFYQATQPVSLASSPLPAGAATAALQPPLTAPGTLGSSSITVTDMRPPTALAAFGIAPVSSTALETGHVFKASPGNLYGVSVYSAVAGFLLEFNSTTVPADGTVAPVRFVPVPAGGIAAISFGEGPPDVLTTGISFAFSTNPSPFTKASSATAFFTASFQ